MGMGDDLAGFPAVIHLDMHRWSAGGGLHAGGQPREVAAEFGQDLGRQVGQEGCLVARHQQRVARGRRMDIEERAPPGFAKDEGAGQFAGEDAGEEAGHAPTRAIAVAAVKCQCQCQCQWWPRRRDPVRNLAAGAFAVAIRLLACAAMNVLADADWATLTSAVRGHCPRLTPSDLAEAERRVDLLCAKIQFRHWISRDRARRLVLGEMGRLGIIAA